MKKQKTQSKIIVALTAVVLLLVALSATLTFAYFSATKDATSSSMTFGKMGLNISGLNGSNLVVTDCAETSCTLSNVVPGCLLTPAGMIQIKNDIDAFVRFRLQIVVSGVSDGEGEAGSGNAAAVAALLDTNANLTIGAANTVQESSANTSANEFIIGNAAAANGGYTKYYYTKVAKTAEATNINVFDMARIKLQIPTTFDNAYQAATFTIKVEVEAIQAEHIFTQSQTAPTINSGVITALGDLESAAAWGNVAANGNGTAVAF